MVSSVFTLEAKDPNTGEKILRLDASELVAVTLPLQPTFFNPGHRPGLRARDWRHETAWYDSEHELLTQLRDQDPLRVDCLRLLLEATFVLQARFMGRERLERRSYERFLKEYKNFCKGHCKDQWPDPDLFLQRVSRSDYLINRIELITALGSDGP